MKKAAGAACYIDSSIILRHAVRDCHALEDLTSLPSIAVTSSLTKVECFRVLDRWRITKEVAEEIVADAWKVTHEFLGGLKVIPIGAAVIDMASQSFPIELKSLDAIHLASALLLRKNDYARVIMVTHDIKLGLATKAMDLDIIGV